MSDTDKILLAAVNSQFIHSNTAVYYLHRMLIDSGINSEVKSFSINDDRHDILRDILSDEPGVVCFSCYIWNISLIYELCNDIKTIDSSIKIILGGPEVTYLPGEAMEKSGADLIIRGEAEGVIVDSVRCILKSGEPRFSGCFYLHEGDFKDFGIAVIENLDSILTPYTKYMMEKESGRLLYYEASRGCPFNCIYCLSSATSGVRYFPLERVFSELDNILEYSPKIVKFTDRSFNINEERTLEILEFLKNKDTQTCFHLEIFPAGLSDAVINAFKTMPDGRAQLEAGIQSVNPRTLEASRRPQDPVAALMNMKKLIEFGNMHIHLDLIAGLPHENIESFIQSFNMTISVSPHMLQIGFLKLLKGTSARNLDGYLYEESPPYEVLATPCLSFSDLSEIKKVEKCMDMFYNTGRFRTFLSYMNNKTNNPYVFYNDLYKYLIENGVTFKGISRNNKYSALAGFAKDDKTAIEHLRYDFMSSYNSKDVPPFLGKGVLGREEIFDILKNDKFRNDNFPDFKDKRAKSIYKFCNISRFDFGSGVESRLFIYSLTNKVTQLFSVRTVQI